MKFSAMQWVVLFGGRGREGIIEELLKTGVNIERVFVPVEKQAQLKGSINKLLSLQLEVEFIGKGSLDESLFGFKHRALLSIGYPFKIARHVYERHPIALNIHPTLLPKYRGPTSGAYILINGETETGSTVHFIVEEFDAGPVVAQSTVPISPFDTLRSMQRKVYSAEPKLVIEALERLDRGSLPVAQEETCSSAYPKIRTPDDSQIDPTRPLIDLINEIRAADPDEFPSFFYYQGERVFIRLWRKDKPTGAKDLL